MKQLFVLFFTLLFTLPAVAQTRNFTISGYIKEAATGEELIGASVLVKELPGTGAAANAYGFYSLTIPEGTYTLTAQFIGFETQTVKVVLTESKKLNFSLTEQGKQLQEVEVSARKENENVTQTQMGVSKLDIREINTVPVLFGEKDVLKTLQLTPGVKTAGEGTSGFYVRGGAADQNLILLDEAIVYNASHLLGFFSVFNSDALRDVTLYKGSQPAQYGGRLASVLDIKMQDGNNQKFGAEGGLGLISSRLKLEGPIKKDEGSFMIAGRRTYADLFLKLSSDTALNQSRLYFYDLNLKANYRLNEKNRIYVSGYFGKDVLGFGDSFGINWGNATATVRWNHLVNDKLFSNTSLIFSNYDYRIKINVLGNKVNIISRLQDYNLKQDFQYFAGARSSFKFGFNSIFHRIIPGAIAFNTDKSTGELKLDDKNALENAVYASHEFKVNQRFTVEYGLRVSAFSAMGPGNFYTYDAGGEAIDTASYKTGDFVKTYVNLEPRVGANFILNEVSSVKASYGRNTQNLHLLSNSTSGSPTDLWIPSSVNVKPEIADQISLGYFRNLKENRYEFSTEVYYKHMQNQVDYKDGADIVFNENVESQLLYGKGRAYGIEFFLKKKTGRFTGWVGYTLSRSERQIEGINQGRYYAARQDRTHDVSLVGIYQLSDKWTFSGTWVYYTGNAITFPSGKYQVEDHILNYYTERNGYRMPAYHRLDIGATLIRKKTEKFESSWNFSVYNAYGRENAYLIQFEEDPNDPSRTRAQQTSLFRWIPSATYNFKF